MAGKVSYRTATEQGFRYNLHKGTCPEISPNVISSPEFHIGLISITFESQKKTSQSVPISYKVLTKTPPSDLGQR